MSYRTLYRDCHHPSQIYIYLPITFSSSESERLHYIQCNSVIFNLDLVSPQENRKGLTSESTQFNEHVSQNMFFFSLIQWITFPRNLFFNIFHVASIHTGVPHSPGRRLRMSISQQSSLRKFLPAKS